MMIAKLPKCRKKENNNIYFNISRTIIDIVDSLALKLATLLPLNLLCSCSNITVTHAYTRGVERPAYNSTTVQNAGMFSDFS